MPENILATDENFETIHRFTAYWERDVNGVVTNEVNDRGGVTRNGITLGFLKSLTDKELADLNKDGKIDIKDVLAANESLAKELFYHEFWINGKARMLPPYTAMVYYDFSVNSGFPNAAINLQKTIDSLRPGTIGSYAGNIGPKTMAAVQKFTKRPDDYKLAIGLLHYRKEFVKEIVNNDPSQASELDGWNNRIQACYKLIVDLYEYGR